MFHVKHFKGERKQNTSVRQALCVPGGPFGCVQKGLGGNVVRMPAFLRGIASSKSRPPIKISSSLQEWRWRLSAQHCAGALQASFPKQRETYPGQSRICYTDFVTARYAALQEYWWNWLLAKMRQKAFQKLSGLLSSQKAWTERDKTVIAFCSSAKDWCLREDFKNFFAWGPTLRPCACFLYFGRIACATGQSPDILFR